MDELNGRVGVVTGAASGIGLAIAHGLAREGVQVVLADVEAGALEQAASTFATPVSTRVCDVSKTEDVQALADHTFAEHGAVHIVCNNAGVAAAGRMWEQTESDWEWVLGVNLWGVVHGIRAFVPRMLASGEPGHVVNTSSMSGMAPVPSVGAYGASKAAIIALTEALHFDFVTTGAALRAHVILPSLTRTRIMDSERNRPAALATEQTTAAPSAGTAAPVTSAQVATGQEPEDVAASVVQAIREDRFWIVPAPSALDRVRVRFESLLTLSNPPVVAIAPVPGRDDGTADPS